MNDIANRLAVQQQVKSRFRGKKRLKSKVILRYKLNIEREYVRIVNRWMESLRNDIDAEMKKVATVAYRERDALRADGIVDIMAAIDKAYDKVSRRNETVIDGLRDKLVVLASLTRKLTISEWKRVCKKTLGLDIFGDYYMGEFYQTAMNQWVDRNVDLIKTIPSSTLAKMKEITKKGFLNGKSITSIMKEIHEEYGMDKRHAKFIARDQMAKLNSELTRMQQEDAGIHEYIWSDSGDQRVRSRHRALNGKRFSWSDPPITDEKTGRRCHPGQDYRCRCCALPVFDYDTINLPIENGGEKNG